jgi:hypothetical protein
VDELENLLGMDLYYVLFALDECSQSQWWLFSNCSWLFSIFNKPMNHHNSATKMRAVLGDNRWRSLVALNFVMNLNSFRLKMRMNYKIDLMDLYCVVFALDEYSLNWLLRFILNCFPRVFWIGRHYEEKANSF